MQAPKVKLFPTQHNVLHLLSCRSEGSAKLKESECTRLLSIGFVEPSNVNGFYRITEAGRQYLKGHKI